MKIVKQSPDGDPTWAGTRPELQGDLVIMEKREFLLFIQNTKVVVDVAMKDEQKGKPSATRMAALNALYNEILEAEQDLRMG